MADNQKADVEGSSEGEGRGSHEPGLGVRGAISPEEVEFPGSSRGGVGCGVGDGVVSKPLPLPPSAAHSPGEMSYLQAAAPESYADRFEGDRKGEGDSGERAESREEGEGGSTGRATDTPGTKGILDTGVGLQPGEISVSIGRTGSLSSPETEELRPIKLQPEDIGGFKMDDTQSPTATGLGTGGDEIIEALNVLDQNGGEDVAAGEESRVEEPTGTEDVSKPSCGVRRAPKADEESIRSPTRTPDQEENTRGGDSGPLSRQLPKTEETSPGAVVREPGSADFRSLGIKHNGGTTKGHGTAINGKNQEKQIAKRVSFAPEPSESNSREKSPTNPETKELEKVADATGEFGYNVGTFKGHDGAMDEKQRCRPAEAKSQPARGPGGGAGAEELQRATSVSGEFGSKVGTVKGHDGTTGRKESDPAQQPRLSPETQELERIADVVGEFGYNIGATKTHYGAIDNRCPDSAPVNPIPESQPPDVGAEGTPESQELGNMVIDSGEIGYNVGDQPSSHPGRRETSGEDLQGQRTAGGLGASAGVSKGQRSNGTSTVSPAAQSQNTNGTAESRKFGSTTIEREVGSHNSAGFPSSHLDRHNAHREHSSGRSQGGEGIAPEAEELGRITMDGGEFGYNVGGLPSSHPGRHRWHSRGRLQDQAGRGTSGSHELSQIKFGNRESGYNIGGFEQRRFGNESETPTASESRHRNKQPTKGGPGHISDMRDSGYYGHSDGEDSHFAQIKESQQEAPFTQCTPGRSATSDIPRSYLHSFISQSPSGLTPLPQSGHATEVIEPENAVTPPCHQSQTITIHELRTILADSKSDLISSITTEFRLQTTKSDPDLIRTQLPNITEMGTDEHRLDRDIEVEFVETEAYPHIQEERGSEKGVGGIAVWGVIRAVLVIVLGLVVLWGSSHFGVGFKEGANWLDRFAEWLFKEGKGSS